MPDYTYTLIIEKKLTCFLQQFKLIYTFFRIVSLFASEKTYYLLHITSYNTNDSNSLSIVVIISQKQGIFYILDQCIINISVYQFILIK